MLAGIADYENDDRILIKTTRHTQSRSEICASRSAAEDSFHSTEHARQFERFTISDVNHFVDILDVYVCRNDLLSDSLDEVRRRLDDLSGLFISFENRSVRICADNLDARVFLFQIATGARNRATGSESGHEVRDLAFSLSPKLW